MTVPGPRPVTIEAAVDSLEAALAAEAAGADRLELCGDLGVGGITPPADLQRDAQRRVRIPCFTMVRPRGGSFAYSQQEVEAMLADVAQARELGAAGIVTGALDDRGDIDVAVMRRLVAAARPLPVTFHKAFDTIADLREALEVLCDLDVDRVLTSGGARTAMAGAGTIAALVRQAAGRIVIVAGGSVSGESAVSLVAGTGVDEIHARCEADGARIRGIVAALRNRQSVP